MSRVSFTSCLVVFLSVHAYFPGNCWPNGAPVNVCDDMTPRHGQNRPQPSRYSPYQITQSANSYRPGDVLQVTITGNGGTPFKGLMVKAYDPETGRPIGLFKGGLGLKTLEDQGCLAITHKDSFPKKAAVIHWVAPNYSGQVAFKTTIVENFNNYFTNLDAIVDQRL
ncbi:ferric-chelate reductase 1-like [Tachypleus tridentatus]|uniref:ferric-chelate reductase 1-like n=1 Tax=Tachypleus tridentatus TaxID=6853 RepID=UPI003FD1F910